ncbi:MAG: metallophosphoesterase [Bdellovibrionales bacterium]|nr:metallophosphoesterase [Bdellovibrionales bacterium]
MAKYKIVVSDLHVGRGRILPDGTMNIQEDFVADRVFKEFIEFYSSGDYAEADIELILNGDILNSLQVDYRGYYSPILTEEIGVEKLRSIAKGHPIFFAALKRFAETPHHKVTYIVGNHDVEMIWERCKETFVELVGAPVTFKNFTYTVDGVHYEHGHQFEALNRLNPKKMFITKDLKEPILNLPWGSHFVINFVIPIKNERPYVDKVRPLKSFVRWCMLNDPVWLIRTLVRASLYFFATRFSKSLYRTTNLVTSMKILREITVPPSYTAAAERILRDNPDVHTVIMGHTHQPKYKQFADGREYLNSGTWTELTSLDLATLGRGTRYTYILVDYSKNPTRPHGYLKEWRGHWHEDIDSSSG